MFLAREIWTSSFFKWSRDLPPQYMLLEMGSMGAYKPPLYRHTRFMLIPCSFWQDSYSVLQAVQISPVILGQNLSKPRTNCNSSKLNWFCILNMSLVREKKSQGIPPGQSFENDLSTFTYYTLQYKGKNDWKKICFKWDVRGQTRGLSSCWIHCRHLFCTKNILWARNGLRKQYTYGCVFMLVGGLRVFFSRANQSKSSKFCTDVAQGML